MTSKRRDPEPVSQLLQPLLARLGVAPDVFLELSERWDELAGPPWSGTSHPQIVRNGELVVQATSPAAVRVLRYASESLAKRLGDHFGGDVISSVRVVSPDR